MSRLFFPEYDAAVRWISAGEGAPILFLPGLSMPVADGFFAVAADASLVGRRRILLDYLGSGASDWPRDFDYSLASHAQVIASVLDRIGCGPVDVVGHSMGGSVAIQLALECPRLVRRLVVAECNLVPGGGSASIRLSRDGEAAFVGGGYAKLMDRLVARAERETRGQTGWQLGGDRPIRVACAPMRRRL